MTDQNQKPGKKFVISEDSTFPKDEDFEGWPAIQTVPGPTMTPNQKLENLSVIPKDGLFSIRQDVTEIFRISASKHPGFVDITTPGGTCTVNTIELVLCLLEQERRWIIDDAHRAGEEGD